MAAAYPYGTASAAGNASADLTLSFEDAGGSTLNTGAKNNKAYTNAIRYLTHKGGGRLLIPAKVYPFSGASVCTAANVMASGYGATFAGDNCCIAINPDSRGYNIEGLTLLETSGGTGTFLLHCYGSQCSFTDMHLEKNPPARGYIAYCREGTFGNLFENMSFSGSNGVFLSGHDHTIKGGWAESYGNDDCWALKAPVTPCYNIQISGFQARGFAALVSIGSEIGSYQADDPTRSSFVKNVVVKDCSARECTYLAYIKPGGVEAYDYRDGLVEDVSILNCQLEDSSGIHFRDGVCVSPGRGAIVRGLTIQNLAITARGASPPVQPISPLYLRVLNSTNGAGTGASIDEVTVAGMQCNDPYGGVQSSGSIHSTPIHSLVTIEKVNSAVGEIGRVDVSDGVINGCARMALSVGPNVSGPISFAGCTFSDYAAGIYGSVDTGSVLAQSPVNLTDITASPSPNAPTDTRGVMGDNAPDKTIQYSGDVAHSSLASIQAGTAVNSPIYSAQRDTWISRVEITVGETIAQDDANYVQFTIRNGSNGDVLASTTSATKGLAFNAGIPTSINGAIQFTGEAAYLPKDAQLLVEISHGGQGADVMDPTFAVHCVPYGAA